MTSKRVVANSLHDLPKIASAILADLSEERIFVFNAKMGAGKTTLIKSICKVLKVQEIVSSPTFSLVNEYTSEKFGPVFHFDFYRIKKIDEVYDIGYEEYLFSDSYCFIEWPELIVDLLPEEFVQIDISVGENEERIIQYGIVKD